MTLMKALDYIVEQMISEYIVYTFCRSEESALHATVLGERRVVCKDHFLFNWKSNISLMATTFEFASDLGAKCQFMM